MATVDPGTNKTSDKAYSSSKDSLMGKQKTAYYTFKQAATALMATTGLTLRQRT